MINQCYTNWTEEHHGGVNAQLYEVWSVLQMILGHSVLLEIILSQHVKLWQTIWNVLSAQGNEQNLLLINGMFCWIISLFHIKFNNIDFSKDKGNTTLVKRYYKFKCKFDPLLICLERCFKIWEKAENLRLMPHGFLLYKALI